MIKFTEMPKEKPRKTRAPLPWSEGYEAGQLIPSPDCPYDQNTTDWVRWWDGFCHAVNEGSP